MDEMLRLLKPHYYHELDVQDALRVYWPSLFPDHPLTSLAVHSNLFRPDLVGANVALNDILICELKTKHTRAGQAVFQVVRYGKIFHAKYPNVTVRLLAIGPWQIEAEFEFQKHDGYPVILVPMTTLVARLFRMSEPLLSYYRILSRVEATHQENRVDTSAWPALSEVKEKT